MKPCHPRTGTLWIGLLLASILSTSAHAKVTIQLPITSTPSGAQVFLRKGTREISIGTTPLTYEASFHSEISILRLLFRKNGYDDKTVEIKASDEVVAVGLTAFEYLAAPTSHGDTRLRALQENVNPLVEETLPELLEKKGALDYAFAGQLNVEEMDGETFLNIPVMLKNFKGKFGTKGAARQKELAETAWKQFGPDLVAPLVMKMKDVQGIEGVVLQLHFDEKRFLFGVSSRIETSVEMECKPGSVSQLVYDACARRRMDGGCEGGNVTRMVYDPCAYRMPVVKRTLKIDPQTGVAQGQALIRYVLRLHRAADKPPTYDDVDVLIKDTEGRTLFTKAHVR
jgi:hypothetical protein